MNLLSQMILSWTLLGVLFIWTFVCAFLAFRPSKTKGRGSAGLPTHSSTFAAIVPRTPLNHPTSSVEMPFGGITVASAEATNDVGAAPVI